jgi:formylglycine-generating enzyme required for sulfatase activity
MGLGAIAVLALFGFAVYLQRAASGPDAPIQPPSPTTTAPQPAVSPPAVSPTQPSGTAGTAVTSGAEMVAVSAGPFWMGSDDGEDNEKPRRRVTLDGFSIDKFEVTNALYQKFVKATGRAAPGHWTASELNGPQQPVVGVSWDDAVAYCAWAGKRLPTEAEWEKAARGTDGSKYPWGDKWDASRANSSESRLGATAKVGSYPSGASPYRAHDMAGNAWEWVADWYDEEYYKKGPDRNPKGPDTGFTRVLRGGSWDLSPVNLRAAYRYDNPPDYRFNRIGFRCARGLSP